MRLYDLTRAYARGGKTRPDLIHMLCAVGPSSATRTFCGLSVRAVTTDLREIDVCPTCVSTAKFWGFQ